MPLELLYSIGIAAVDDSLRAVIALVEQRFPQRVRGYYLVGSYAVGEALPSSDLDVLVLFAGEMDVDEQTRFATVRVECKQFSSVTLDLICQSEIRLFRVGGVWFQTANRLLYGEDVRAAVPRKPVANHTRDLMHAVYPLLARVRDDPPALMLPLGYPDPDAEFYGYNRRQVQTADGLHSVGTKDLLNIVLAIANALTLQRSGAYVGTGAKSDIARQYRTHVGDEWADLVKECYEYCRNRWGYGLPQAAEDRGLLRALCQHTLAFENHFLRCYRVWLLDEVQHGDADARQRATTRLAQVMYVSR